MGTCGVNFLANPIITITASEIAPFFFFFRSRYCMEFKTESLTHHCAMENRPWPDGCSISERATQCAWIVNLQLWTLWAFVVLVMAWTLMGKGETGWRILSALIWGDMSFSCYAQQTNIQFGESQQWETFIWLFQSPGPSSHSRT